MRRQRNNFYILRHMRKISFISKSRCHKSLARKSFEGGVGHNIRVPSYVWIKDKTKKLHAFWGRFMSQIYQDLCYCLIVLFYFSF